MPTASKKVLFCILLLVAPVFGYGATTSSGTAQIKAEKQAREGRCYHVGGSFGGGTAEGVGFSTVSADHAIRSCCFWGRRTPIQIGVARGSRGWYACVLYR
jgi:hypothetical protein